jgi:hypothetical protein
MRKLNWKYDKKFKIWWVGESTPYANDGISIKKDEFGYRLKMDIMLSSPSFKKLSSAKKVAELITNG